MTIFRPFFRKRSFNPLPVIISAIENPVSKYSPPFPNIRTLPVLLILPIFFVLYAHKFTQYLIFILRRKHPQPLYYRVFILLTLTKYTRMHPKRALQIHFHPLSCKQTSLLTLQLHLPCFHRRFHSSNSISLLSFWPPNNWPQWTRWLWLSTLSCQRHLQASSLLDYNKTFIQKVI